MVKLLHFSGIPKSKYYDWKARFGQANIPSRPPCEHRVLPEEKQLIVDFYLDQFKEGYRRCAYQLIDNDIAYVSPSSVYRVLDEAGVLNHWNRKPSLKGSGFDQPISPHEHWHMDISYVRLKGIYYYLICVLDGYSRTILQWDLRESMTDTDVGIVHLKALEKYPKQTPRMITDNGSQFTGGEFKKFIAENGLSHVKTSVAYPQSNGKIERFHKTIKTECIREKLPVDLKEAKRVIERYIDYYNYERLHSAIGYVTPYDKLKGNAELIQNRRKQKLALARRARKLFYLSETQEKLTQRNHQPQEQFSISAEGRSEATLCLNGS